MTLLDVPLERKGMKLLEVVTVVRHGKRINIATILCTCDKKFKVTLSRWRHGLFDSCKACGLKRAKEKGCGIFGGGKNLRS